VRADLIVPHQPTFLKKIAAGGSALGGYGPVHILVCRLYIEVEVWCVKEDMVCYTGQLGQGVVQGTGTCSIESEREGHREWPCSDRCSQAPGRHDNRLRTACGLAVCVVRSLECSAGSMMKLLDV